MKPTQKNVILIGMPGSGKSTVGVLLAKQLARDFLDTDVLIQVREGRPLQQILDAGGVDALRRIEEESLCELACAGTVVATGGSAVYSAPAMEHLGAGGPIVYLEVPLDELRRRVTNFASRGIAKAPNQSFADLYAERQPLYEIHADITIRCEGLNPAQVTEAVLQALRDSEPWK
jgi:shikimate kinase